MGQRVKLYNSPEAYEDFFDDRPDDFHPLEDVASELDFIHYFAVDADQLVGDLPELRKQLSPNGMLWISWPKKSSRVTTDLNGNIVREAGLRHGLVDIKVCSVNEVWSALKFVIPVKDRM